MELDNIERKLIQEIQTNQDIADDYLAIVRDSQKLLDVYQKNK